MTNKKQHISEEDFQRYLENQMTDTERNTFERELQKHPFEAEALEGFKEISPNELKTDLQKLRSKIKTGKRKPKTHLWAAAATILLLISTGILWFQLKDKSPVPELTESSTIQKQEEVTPSQKSSREKIQTDKLTAEAPEMEAEKSSQTKLQKGSEPIPDAKSIAVRKEIQSLKDQVNESATLHTTEIKQEKNSSVSISDSHVVIRGASRIRANPVAPNVAFSQAALSTNSSDKIIKGKVISLADSLPLPGTTVIEKGTQNGVITDINGNFTLKLTGKNDSLLTASFVGMHTREFHPSPDSLNVIGLEPEQMAMDEVVVTGYGSSGKKKTLTGSVSRVTKIKDSKVQPVERMKKYKSYLSKKAILPDNYKRNREVVKLLIHLDETGKITNIENKNQADTFVFNQAKKMVNNGPEWKPEIKNGKPVKSHTELRIVFRKTN